jgi:hypothetical protein
MYISIVFFVAIFWKKVFAAEYQVCTGYNINVTHFNDHDKLDVVYSYIFDINVNLNKNYVDKNEIIISNYNYSSYNDLVYFRSNSSSICSGIKFREFGYNKCFQWAPSNDSSFIKELPFQIYSLSYFTKLDNSLTTDTFDFIIDKKLMAFQINERGYNNYNYYNTKCLKPYYDAKDIRICCNNYIPVTIPDTYETCLHYTTTASVSMNSRTLYNFQAIYANVPSQLKIFDNQMNTTFYDHYEFHVNTVTDDNYDISKCIYEFDDTNNDCNLDIANTTFSYNFVLVPYYCSTPSCQYKYDYGAIVSKLRIINGIPLKEDFSPFTKANPCWIPSSNSIPFANDSMILSASFCCTSFGRTITISPAGYLSSTSTSSSTITHFKPIPTQPSKAAMVATINFSLICFVSLVSFLIFAI